jgi:monoamine oxidase
MMRPTRRSVGLGLAAAPIVGGSAALPSNPRVAIIGAGVAGLAASKVLTQAGVSHIILESWHTIGGRARTALIDGLPLDMGAGWLHSADLNPFTRIADAFGLKTIPDNGPWGLYDKGVRQPSQLSDQVEVEIAKIEDALDARALMLQDRAVADLARGSNTLAQRAARAELEQSFGLSLDRVSALDAARQIATDDERFVEGGVGGLIARWGADAPVRFNTAVFQVALRKHGVRLEGSWGALDVEACLITTSIAVLKSHVISFVPRLPELDAILDGFRMGYLEKLILPMRRQSLRDWPINSSAMALDGDAAVSFIVRPFGMNVVIGMIAQPHAAKVDPLDQVFAAIGSLFGSASMAPRSRGGARTYWSTDPGFFGSYSAVKVGYAHLRAQPKPIGDRIYLAGEAFDQEWGTQIVGAKRSGERAAQAMVEAFRQRR